MRYRRSVFIAGPMTGYAGYNRDAFFDMERKLKLAGFIVINPAILPIGLGDSVIYLTITIPMVDLADVVVALKGWERSAGAVQEIARALSDGKAVFYEGENTHKEGRQKEYQKDAETITRIVCEGCGNADSVLPS